MNNIEFLKTLIEVIKCQNSFSDAYMVLLKGINRIINERWITIHPHGEGSDDYRRIKLRDGETPKQAIDRVYKKEDKKNKDISKIIKTKADILDDYIQKIKKYNKNRYKYTKEQKQKLYNEIKEIEKKFDNINKEEQEYIKSHSAAYSENSNIVGVAKSNPMDFEKADSNNVNPKFSRDSYEHSHNCQSCVVAYEARRRGYDVQVVPRNKYNKTQQLAEHSSWAYIDPKTNEVCEPKSLYAANTLNLYNKLDSNVKSNERYTLSYTWHEGKLKGSHILTIERDENNELRIYDPQNSRIIAGKENIISHFKERIKYNGTEPLKILRTDDKAFNKYFINDVVRKN